MCDSCGTPRPGDVEYVARSDEHDTHNDRPYSDGEPLPALEKFRGSGSFPARAKIPAFAEISAEREFVVGLPVHSRLFWRSAGRSAPEFLGGMGHGYRGACARNGTFCRFDTPASTGT